MTIDHAARSHAKLPGGSLTRRHLLAGAGAGLLAAIAPGGRLAAAPPELRRGVNLWPWFSLTRELPAPSRAYDWPPYQPDRAVPRRADLVRIKTLGFDFVRIPVDPGPLISFAGERRKRLLRDVLDAVALARGAGLTVVVNLHPNAATHYWRPEAFASGVHALHAPDLRELAKLLAAALTEVAGEGVAFEPVNEPPGQCVSTDWLRLQAALLADIRRVAPRLTVVVTGACGSQIAGLEALDVRALRDPSLLFTFHFYEPYMFSHQGARWMTGEPMYRYLDRVPWPASAGSLDEAIAAFDAHIANDAALSPAMKGQVRATAVAALRQYFEARPAKAFVELNLRPAAEWADKNAIPRQRLLLGELGAVRMAARSHRARYVRDVRETAEELGFAWAFWNYFSAEMGLVEDDAGREPDAGIIAALGLGS